MSSLDNEGEGCGGGMWGRGVGEGCGVGMGISTMGSGYETVVKQLDFFQLSK